MRLVAVARAAIGLRSQPAYIKTGRYTALVGSNDTGKSLWLESIAHAVTGAPYDDDPGPGPMAVVVVEFEDLDELDAAVEPRFGRFSRPTESDDLIVWSRSFDSLDVMSEDDLDSVFEAETATQWVSYLEAHLDDLGRRLLAIALETPTVLMASTEGGDGWVDVSWLAVDAGDPDVQAIDNELRSRTGEGLPNPVMYSSSPPTNPEGVPLAALPLLSPLRRSVFAVMRPTADIQRLRARIEEGAVLEGRAFADRAMRWMPPMLRDRYRLVISERMNAPAEVGIQHATESERSAYAFDLGALARGWWLWLAVAVELAHFELTPTYDDDDDDADDPAPLGVLIVDEPEQHLHADAQRAMSRWLTELSEMLTVFVATHSVAFADPLGTHSTIVRLLPNDEEPRDDAHAWMLARWNSSVVVQPERISADEDLARCLGWTRGELFASLETILFVEGIADQVVLDELFSGDLRAAGIVVCPIHGMTRAPAIAAAELVHRMPDVRLALLIDDLPPSVIDELKAMSHDELEHRAKSGPLSTEEKGVIDLLRQLRAQSRDKLEIYTHEAPDVIALLDEDALAAELPGYPGHAEVRKRRAEQEGQGTWKDVMSGYGFKKKDGNWQIELVRRVAARMRESATPRPVKLEEIIDEIAKGTQASSHRW